ncbi:MAG: alcohol dehydrogenase catalytic domain-containing protein [Anaerolineae bacterium]|nr:alcohol dehydrogenase catalytic domain-containing protein [Anaerolineae bacterium]
MKAALLYGVGDLRVEEIDPPVLSHPDEVLVRIHACGICPSDLRAYTGVSTPHRGWPYTPGHEWAGEVVSVGAEVEGFAPGDRVVPNPMLVCGTCYNCIRGLYSFCENLQRGRIRGGFAQFGTAPAASLHKVPPAVSYRQASFGEPLACCVAGSKQSRIGFGADVVILGAGQIGLMHLQLARLSGARVIVSDVIPERLQKAEALGAHAVIDAGLRDPVQVVQELTAGRGADVVIVAVGVPKAEQQALDMAGVGATINFFAGTYPPTSIPLDPNRIHYRQISLTGSHDYGPIDFRDALRFIELRAVDVDALVSHDLPLERTKEGFDIVAERKGLKVSIHM